MVDLQKKFNSQGRWNLSFRFRNLSKLGNRVEVPIPTDSDGFVGRECPESECDGYFKIKPGTGLTGSDLPCNCPYCGHTDSHDRFWTKDQVEYDDQLPSERSRMPSALI